MKSYNVSAPIKTRSSLKIALPQIIAVTVKNLLLMTSGMTMGYSTILIPGLSGDDPNENIHLSEAQISWIGSINFMCIPFGSLLSGIITQSIGRRRSMQIMIFPFVASWLIFHFSTQVWHIYLALCLFGLTNGLVEAPILAYVVEVTTPSIRGILAATGTLSLTLGVLFQFLLGSFMSWRVVALVSTVVPIVAFFLLMFMPESPHWLIMHKKLEEAHKSLAWLRGWAKVEDVDEEFETMCINHDLFISKGQYGIDNQKTRNTLKKHSLIETLQPFIRKSFLHPFSVLAFLFFLSTFTGAWTLQTYAVNLFITLKSPLNKYYATIILGVAEFIGCLITIITVSCFGKRVVAFLSVGGVGLCNVVIGTYAYLNAIHYIQFKQEEISEIPSIDEHNWIPLLFLVLLAFIGHCGLRGLPWILLGELYSHKTRGIGCGVSCTVAYIFGALSNKVFLNMIHLLTIPGTFWLYATIAIFGCVVVHFILPETEGKPLQEISDHFAGISKLDNKVRKKNARNDNIMM